MSGQRIDRLAWIQKSKEAGRDFAALVRDVSMLVVEWSDDHGGLVVDSSAIDDDPHSLKIWVLYQEPVSAQRGHWYHAESGESGLLTELLISIAMVARVSVEDA